MSFSTLGFIESVEWKTLIFQVDPHVCAGVGASKRSVIDEAERLKFNSCAQVVLATDRLSPVAMATEDFGHTMPSLSLPLAVDEQFRCTQEECRCRSPKSPKKDKGQGKDDAILMEWQDVDPSAVEEPLNFAQVDHQLYRSSFPKPANYSYLESLGLKTILCLVEDEPLPAQYLQWTTEHHIQLFQIGMPGHKEAFRAGIPYELVGEALRLVVNMSNYPMLIHCNRGKHRTGTVVACLRKLKGWHTTRAVDEYTRFSHPKERATDQDFISAFEKSELRTRVFRHRLLAGLVPESPSSPFSSMLNLAKA